MKSHETIGRAGEFLAAHVLETQDIRVTHANVSGHDLWCRTPTGRLVSVQVKTTSQPIVHHGNALYDFSQTSFSWMPDVYAFCALDIGMMICEASMSRRRKIRVDAFTQDNMLASVAKFFY